MLGTTGRPSIFWSSSVAAPERAQKRKAVGTATPPGPLTEEQRRALGEFLELVRQRDRR